MKKYLLMSLAVLFSVGVWAADAEGSSKNPVAFDWEKGNVLDPTVYAGLDSVWFQVDLAPLYEEENPTLALYLTNLTSDRTATVRMSASLAGQSETRQYSIAAKQNMIWSKQAGILIRLNQKQILLALTTDTKIAISARVYETAYTDEACLKAVDFNWTSGHTQTATAEGKWYKVDLSAAKAASDKDIVIQISNNGTTTAKIAGALSTDCPSSGTTDYSTTLAAGATHEKRLNRALLESMNVDELYVRVINDQTVHVGAQLVEKEAGSGVTIACADAATRLLLNQEFNVVAGDNAFYIEMDSLRKKRVMPELTIVNNGAAKANITAYIAFKCGDDVDAIKKMNSLNAGQVLVKEIEKNMIEGISADTAYIKIVSDQDLTVTGRLKRQGEGDACKNSVDFDWLKGAYQEGGNDAKWYAISIKEAKEQVKDINITLTNRSGREATVKAEVAFECPYVDLETMTRKIAGNAVLTKTIPYSTFGALGTDVIYVGVTTNEALKLEAVAQDIELNPTTDDACLTAEIFDWTYGHALNAGETKWYKVGLNEIRNNTAMIPVLRIKNQGTATATINAEMSIECPDSIPNATRTLTIGKDKTFERQMARDMFKNISNDIDTVYIKLTSTQSITFEVSMLKENEGSNCSSAKLFNWVSGEDLKADSTMWYAIDLSEVKNSKKDVKITIINKQQTEGKLLAALAPECPCETPQEQSAKLAAGAEKSKVLPNSTFEKFGDVVYVRLTAGTNIHFQAELVEPEPFDAIDACNSAIELAFDHLYTQNAVDTVWYYLPKTVLEAAMTDEELYSPQLTIWNHSGATLSLKAEVAYHCPVTQAMESKTVSFSGDSITKILERSMAEQFLNMDSVLIRLIGKDFSFQVSMVDANDGEDCAHATIIVPGDTISHNWYDMEANTTKWYRLYCADLVQTPSMIRAIVKSNGVPFGTDAVVKAELYNSCGGDLLESATRKIHSATSISKEASSDLLAGLSDGVLYLRISTNEPISLTLDTFARKMLEEPDMICMQAMPVLTNIRYYQAATDTVWYMVDTKNLRNNTMGDGTLEVTNMAGKQMKMKAELTYDCPVIYEMTEKTISLNAGDTFTKTAERATLNNIKQDYAYLRVSVTNASEFTAADSLNFILSIEQNTGDRCNNPIMFDWKNGNIHPADSIYWYEVKIAEPIEGTDNFAITQIPEGCDLRLWIENLDDKVGNAETTLFLDCPTRASADESGLGTKSYIFQPNSLVHKDISRRQLEILKTPSLLLLLSSQRNLHIYAEIIPSLGIEERYETTRVRICEEQTYIDPIKGTIYYVAEDPHVEGDLTRYIDPRFDCTWVWNDTIEFTDELLVYDSIYTFIVTPLHTAESITAADLPAAMPIYAAQGAPLYVDSLAKWLDMKHAEDLTAAPKVGDAEWKIQKPGDADYLDLTDAIIAKGITSINLMYSYEDTCENGVVDELLNIQVAEWKVMVAEDTTKVDGACEGTLVSWRGHNFVLKNDTIVNDTVLNVTYAVDTLGQTINQTVDSVYVLSYTNVIMAPEWPSIQELIPAPTIAYNQNIDIKNTDDDLIDGYGVDDTEWYFRFNGISTWTKLNRTAASNPVVELSKDTVFLYYKASFCNNEHESQPDTFVVAPITLYETVTVTICQGDAPYEWNGNSYENSDLYNYYTVSALNARCDSIVTLDLTITDKLEVNDDDITLCAGEHFVWKNIDIASVTVADAGEYKDTTISVGGCDSIVTVILYVNQPIEMEMDSVALCEGERFEWNDVVIDSVTVADAREYIFNGTTAAGCDSIAKIKLIITTEKEVVLDPISVCEGEPFSWNGIEIAAVTTEDAKEYTYRTEAAIGCDSVTKVTLVVNQPIEMEMDSISLCEGERFEWNDVVIDSVTVADAREYIFNGTTAAGCDSIAKMKLIITTEKEVVLDPISVCEGEPFSWNGIEIAAVSITDAKQYSYRTEAAIGCDSVTKVTLVVNLPAKVYLNDTTLTEGDAFEWNDIRIEAVALADAKEYSYSSTTVAGCDSTVYIKLVVEPKPEPIIETYNVVIIDTVCPGTEYNGRLGKVVITEDKSWSDTISVREESLAYDSIYHYNILTYKSVLAAYTMDDIHVICGQTIDVEAGNEALEAMIAENDMFAPDYTIEWSARAAGENEFKPIDESLIVSSKYESYEIAYTITTCDATLSSNAVLAVEMATPENTSSYDQLAAEALFGGRILMINLDAIRALIDTVPNPEDVEWYEIVGTIDEVGVEGDDKKVGTGHYYTLPDGDPLLTEGKSYYARINISIDLSESECEQIMRTKVLDNVGPSNVAPALRPSIAAPGETIEIYNLNPTDVAEINVYNIEGVLVETYRAEEVASFFIHAAQSTGYYMVHIGSEQNKVTLKYIVK